MRLQRARALWRVTGDAIEPSVFFQSQRIRAQRMEISTRRQTFNPRQSNARTLYSRSPFFARPPPPRSLSQSVDALAKATQPLASHRDSARIPSQTNSKHNATNE